MLARKLLWLAGSNTLVDQGKIAFIELRDGSGFIQCVAEAKNLGEDKFSRLAGLNIESSLSLTGTVSKHPKKEEYELQVSDFHVYTDTKDYPLGQKNTIQIFFLI
jgi:asparaginyl-tRNA synthetase